MLQQGLPRLWLCASSAHAWDCVKRCRTDLHLSPSLMQNLMPYLPVNCGVVWWQTLTSGSQSFVTVTVFWTTNNCPPSGSLSSSIHSSLNLVQHLKTRGWYRASFPWTVVGISCVSVAMSLSWSKTCLFTAAWQEEKRNLLWTDETRILFLLIFDCHKRNTQQLPNHTSMRRSPLEFTVWWHCVCVCMDMCVCVF